MYGQKLMWAVVLYAAGFVSSYIMHRAEAYELEQAALQATP
jgi:hypothetical protein